MKVITDASANLTAEKAAALGVEMVPFQVTFMGKTYKDGVDIHPEDLYKMYLENPNEFVTTSQPSPGDIVTVYEKCGNEEIISIHLSSGLSGAYASAEQAARMVKNPNITVIDPFTVGPALGWMVEVAANGVKSGWSIERYPRDRAEGEREYNNHGNFQRPEIPDSQWKGQSSLKALLLQY